MGMKIRIKDLSYLAIIGLLIGLLAGCSGGASSEAQADPAVYFSDASEEVSILYKNHCLSCHGNVLQGRVGVKSNIQRVGARKSTEQIIQIIRKGSKGMIAFENKLTPEEINALASWLSLKK